MLLAATRRPLQSRPRMGTKNEFGTNALLRPTQSKTPARGQDGNPKESGCSYFAPRFSGSAGEVVGRRITSAPIGNGLLALANNSETCQIS